MTGNLADGLRELAFQARQQQHQLRLLNGRQHLAQLFEALVAGRTSVVPRDTAPGVVAASAGGDEEEAVDEGIDVADLDESALRRLLKRLGARAPANVSALAAVGDGQDVSDPSFEDDGQVNDELAELDGPALLRIERSLAGASL